MGTDFFNHTILGSPKYNNFNDIDKKIKSAPVNLFSNLIKKNINFQTNFVNIICDYVNIIYKRETINKLIERYKKEFSDIIANSQLRWSGINYSSVYEGFSFYKTTYYKALDSLNDFFEQRPKYFYQYMKEYIGLKGNIVDLTIEIKGRGTIQINSIIPRFNNRIWSGNYFSLIPISIKAIPDIGYKFVEWDGYIHSIQQNQEIILFNSSKIIAIFE